MNEPPVEDPCESPDRRAKRKRGKKRRGATHAKEQ